MVRADDTMVRADDTMVRSDGAMVPPSFGEKQWISRRAEAK